MRRVLHVLSQRPHLTGSGVMLDAMVRHAARAGWEQRVVCGVPAEDAEVRVGDLGAPQVSCVRFGAGPLDFAVPGMSDGMPYRSTRFRDLSAAQLAAYRAAWHEHLRREVEEFRPDVVQSHHVWIVSGVVLDVCAAAAAGPGARSIPVVVQGHGTDLRQMALCPGLAPAVRRACARATAISCLHQEHAQRYAEELGIEPARCPVVGAGYDETLFHCRGRAPDPGPVLTYAGKLSRAKGVDCLLDAFARCLGEFPGATLHVAGGGEGDEAEEIRARMQALAPRVQYHGRLEQPALASRLRATRVFVLASLYEGLPLVLVEALASGCQVVSTALPHLGPLAAAAGEHLIAVPMPALRGVDQVEPAARPAFVESLAGALRSALARPVVPADENALSRRLSAFRWEAVGTRLERVWESALSQG